MKVATGGALKQTGTSRDQAGSERNARLVEKN
jgi:hypothetical protein